MFIDITNLPRSLPRNVSKSFSVLTTAITASPVTGPFVPGVQAFGYAISGYARGVTALATKRWFCQPRPNGQDSVFTFAMPHSFIVFSAQSAASLMLGEPVRRGP